MATRVIIIGLGRIGKRHLQAVLRLGSAVEIITYDCQPEALESLDVFGRENNLDVARVVRERTFEKILNDMTADSIVVVATTAAGRLPLMEAILSRRPKAVIVEKPVCQSLTEYDQILGLAAQAKTPIYCNFSRHAYPCYQQIKNMVKESSEGIYQAVFQGGMACVGIHFLELFIWLGGANNVVIDHVHFQDVHETQRQGFYDFYGTMTVRFNDHSRCWLVATPDHHVTSVGMTFKDKEFRIFEGKGQMLSTSTTLEPVDIVPTSRITDAAVQAILENKQVQLPDIKQVRLAHQVLFEAMARQGLEAVNIT